MVGHPQGFGDSAGLGGGISRGRGAINPAASESDAGINDISFIKDRADDSSRTGLFDPHRTIVTSNDDQASNDYSDDVTTWIRF